MNQARVVLAALAAGSCSVAGATGADEPLDQIIVSASRTPLSVNAVGSAVTVITRDDIERRQARYVTDLLRQVPGFAVSQSGVTGSQTQVRVRGAEANHVLVLVDGARANDPATGDEFRWEFLTTANIERIEVVRGPQSAIWGSDALAGIVNIITRSGDAAPAIDAYVETGSDDTFNNAISGSLRAGGWNLGMSFERLATDGDNVSRSGSENDDSKATTAAVNASWDAGDAFLLQFGARSVDAWSQYDTVDYAVTGLPADSDVALDTTQHHGQLAMIVGAPDSRLRHRLAARYFDTENRNFTDGNEDVSSLSDRWTFSYQADIGIADDTLSLALEHEATGFRQRGPVGFGDPNQDQDMDVTSVVVEYQGRFGRDVSWVASARYDDNSVFEDALTGRLSVSLPLAERTRLRASAGTGRKNPTFIELYGYYPGQFVNNPDLEPEESTGYEIGIEQGFGNGLDVQVTAFRQDLDNEINGFVFDPVTFLSTAENMEGRSRRSGVEAGMRWNLGDALAINATYTWLESTAEDVREVRRPRHSGSIDLDHAIFSGRGRLVFAATYGGTRTDTFFAPWPEPPQTVTLDSHWLVDVTGHFALSQSVEMFARISNLLDTEYEHVFGYNTPGRRAFAGVRVTFGR